MALPGTRKCLCCHTYFKPDHRNRRHQRYCSSSVCRKSSKAASQRKWLSKPENRHYFSGPDQVARVQAWRKKNPSYSSNKKTSQQSSALQDRLSPQETDLHQKNGRHTAPALQDLLNAQETVFIGFLANLCGSTLQEDIAEIGNKLLQSGLDILQTPQLQESMPP